MVKRRQQSVVNKAPLLIGIPGSVLSRTTETQLRTVNPMGIILFARNYENESQLKRLNQDIRSILGDDTIIAVDHEGGRVVRFPQILPSLPSPSVLGGERNPEKIHRLSRETADGLRELGITLNLAPVVDVATPFSHASIRDRCYSTDPAWVAEMAVAFVKGMQDAGVKCAGKHFPGLGLALQDTHESGTIVNATREKLEQSWPPFRKIITAGVDAILVSHAMYMAMDAVNPATFSKKIVTDILRYELGFSGLIIADDLTMGAITNRFSIDDAVNKCLAAGCDLASICHDY